jgi:hypothetical protein
MAQGFAGGQVAPVEATYITQTPHGVLSAEQALSLLATGHLKSTTGTGVITSTAIIPVADGGTGVASLTAYGVVVGGTTSTGPVQSVAVGVSGQLLTSNGAGVAPTFQTVNAITIGRALALVNFNGIL